MIISYLNIKGIVAFPRERQALLFKWVERGAELPGL
jgi:hypothetical protein